MVVDQIRVELVRDVNKMKEVASPKSPFWTDITDSKKGTPEQRTKLVEEVSGRIVAGENQIAAQDLDSLVD